jgi:hypothetical protein
MTRFGAGRWAIVVVALVAACSPQGLTIGPVPVSLPVEGGSINPDEFILIPGGVELEFTIRQDFCALPTEQEITDRLPELASIDLSRIVRLKEIELAGLVLTATSGDFSFLREITVSYVPKSLLGLEGDPVVIGYAESPDGFGDSVVLTPPSDVDLLELIRDNDDNPSPGCPQVDITIRGVRPQETVEWEGLVETDVFATIGG